MFFSSAFFNGFSGGLGGVLGRFWEGFGTFLASLGALLSVFFQGFVAERAQEGPRDGQEASWARFGMVLGRVWEAKMVKKSIFLVFFLICFSRLSFGRILFDF